MIDLQRDRFSYFLYPKETNSSASPVGRTSKGRFGLSTHGFGTIVIDKGGNITRVWKHWGEVRDDEAQALAYSLVDAFKNLADEGNTQARISVRQSPKANTTLTFDFEGKVLELSIYDCPGGSLNVSLAEGVSTD